MTRVAYLPDSFHEVNGVAHTSRQFEAFARRRGLPFLCIRAGRRATPFLADAEVATLELPRSFLSFPLDKDLRFDPLWFRHWATILAAVKTFRPDIIHITGPSEVGLVGAILAHHLRIPLAASWHTNVHEYAARRMNWLFDRLPAPQAARGARFIEGATLSLTSRFYQLARILFAPNPELCRLLENRTGRPCYLMRRGVDTDLFSPRWRVRAEEDRQFVLGYTGRLSIEKNVALLATVQHELERRGITNFRFRIVGQGSEEPWLRHHLPRAEFCGVLRGDALARAYAGMDVFVFPSHTDTFGNVVLEALASAVPAVVTPDGGPQTLIRHGVSGMVATDAEFASAVATILQDQPLLASMRTAARQYALSASWDAVFDSVYAAYESLTASPVRVPL